MRRIFQLTSLVVLALWVPTTVHCNLESLLGWQPTDCCNDQAGDAPAHADCCAVEDGAYRTTDASVTVAAPELLICWSGRAVCVNEAVAALALVTADFESPPELACTWQFVERAAPPARAPSYVS